MSATFFKLDFYLLFYSKLNGYCREIFCEELHVLIATKREHNCFYFSQESTLKYFLKWNTFQSPYEAIFGVKPKRSIASSSLSGNQITNIETEKHLKEIFEEYPSSVHTKVSIPKENIEKRLQPTTSSYQPLTEQQISLIRGLHSPTPNFVRFVNAWYLFLLFSYEFRKKRTTLKTWKLENNLISMYFLITWDFNILFSCFYHNNLTNVQNMNI